MKTFATICSLAIIAFQASAIGIGADNVSLDLKADSGSIDLKIDVNEARPPF
jgi:hypothetical protein